jgi:GTP-binding protein HflX
VSGGDRRIIFTACSKAIADKESLIKTVHGNLAGLKHSQIQRLERLYRRRVQPHEVISLDVARELIAASSDIGRQLGVLIDRYGLIPYVIVGDERSIFIPETKDYPLGKRRLRGLRLVHTHLKGEPLHGDDFTDLGLLRLDLIALLDARSPSPPEVTVSYATLRGASPGESPSIVHPPYVVGRIEPDLRHLLDETEAALAGSRVAAEIVASGQETAILISVSKDRAEDAEAALEELRELARSANVHVLDAVIQRPRQFSSKYLMGEGKLREVIIRALQLGASLLIFDQELTPTQVRSISSLTELKVIDRSQLILDIFARRARSQDGKVQVELAQLKYLLPRLSGRGVQMSRLMGGIGGRGPGETKLELDRRRIRDRIAKLERELAALSECRIQRRQKRVRSGIPIISIIGYTNAGKSTLLNTLTKSDVFTEDLLFATLDTSSRRLRLPREREIIITDTVGFIRSLPESLLGAFKATLEELQDADLLIHLVDCSNSNFIQQISQVNAILDDLHLTGKEKLLVFNKSDLLERMRTHDPLSFLRARHFMNKADALRVSAQDKRSLTPLLGALQKRFWPED